MSCRQISKAMTALLLAVSLILIIPQPTHAQDLREEGPNTGILNDHWHARLWPKNKKFVEVAIDTSSLPGDLYLSDVKLVVSFFDSSNRFVGRQEYEFTDSRCLALIRRKPYSPYVRYYQHPFGSAKYAKGETINSFSRSIGSIPRAGTPTIGLISLILLFRSIFGIRRKDRKDNLIGSLARVNGRAPRLDEDGTIIIGQAPASEIPKK